MTISPSVTPYYLYLTYQTILTRKSTILDVVLTVLMSCSKSSHLDPILFQFNEFIDSKIATIHHSMRAQFPLNFYVRYVNMLVIRNFLQIFCMIGYIKGGTNVEAQISNQTSMYNVIRKLREGYRKGLDYDI